MHCAPPPASPPAPPPAPPPASPPAPTPMELTDSGGNCKTCVHRNLLLYNNYCLVNYLRAIVSCSHRCCDTISKGC